MKQVNAGMKSKEEMRQRLESGEKGLTIYSRELIYDAENIYLGGSQYLIEDGTEFEPIIKYWKHFAEVTKQVSWEDEVSPNNPIPCWVSDENDGLKNRLDLIFSINKEAGGGFIFDGNQSKWKFAKRVKPSECWGYE